MRETQARSVTHEREARALEMERAYRAEFLVYKIVQITLTTSNMRHMFDDLLQGYNLNYSSIISSINSIFNGRVSSMSYCAYL